ncbi:MAG TPA: YdcF family protein [Casimicrobiaceae bacterium]|nr:YdcF family protein [Casimicrobiaceae bacterium]
MKASRARPWLVVALVVTACAGVYAIRHAGYWLQAPAQAPVRADAIVVLGGDDGARALRGLQLYRDGYAPLLVLTGVAHGETAPPVELTWRADFLVARGVPRSALSFEFESKSSYAEAVNILAQMRRQRWQRVIVVSDPPHMRRLAWTWAHVFEGSDLKYVLVASDPAWWSPGDWWRDEASGSFVIMEFIKFGYYIAER